MNLHKDIIDQFKNKSEQVNREDRGVLTKIGISAYPFFKFTKGTNSIVVYAYEADNIKQVVKLKEKPSFDFGWAKKLADAGFNVVEFVSTNTAPAGILYRGNCVNNYEITKWIGYDFDIRLEAALTALKEVGFKEHTKKGNAAVSMMQADMYEVGRLVGQLFKREILYSDLKPRNLAKNGGGITLFDLDMGYVKVSNNTGEHANKACRYLDFVKQKLQVYNITRIWYLLLNCFYTGLDAEKAVKLKKHILNRNPLPKGFRS